MSRGQSQPRNHSVKRVPERCRTRDTIEIIDVEEKINLVIVDAEEASNQGSRGSGTARRNSCPSDVISIQDDDGDTDDTLRNVHGGATSKENRSISNNSPISEESGCNVSSMPIRTGNPCFKSMGYMRKHNDIGPSASRYGLGYSSESQNSDSDSTEFYSFISDGDSSDCEIMEGPSGNIRERWERAALRKRMMDRVRFCSDGQASVSGSSADAIPSSDEATYSKVDINHTNHSGEIPFESCPNNSNSVNEDLTFNKHVPAGKIISETTDQDTGTINNIGHKEPKCASEAFSHRAQSTNEALSDNVRLGMRNPEIVLGSSKFHLNMQHDPNIKDDDVNSLDKSGQVPNGTTFGAGLPGNFSFSSKVVPVPGKLDGEQFSPNGTIQDKEKLPCGKSSTSLKPRSEAISSPEIAEFQEKEKPSFDEPSLCNDQGSDQPVLNSETSVKEPQACNANEGNGTIVRSISYDPGPSNMLQVDNGLLSRERHKESNEYRRAVEEEWAARQRQLQIQAEEVQRLKRRRKAETLRLLDMEKRQKQRLEEMRESQKKDEETITLKEHMRAEVRKELDKMELRYRDMASLLRGLGIHVKGGLFPLPQEVNAAYKQALLKFHPDRASKLDIREQVKAEEIFKLISRLKEKLMS